MIRIVRTRPPRGLILAAIVSVAVAVGGIAAGGARGAVAAGGSVDRSAISTTGTIAYVRGLQELHLIQPDGSNDHVIWTEPAASNGLQNLLLAPSWRPDSAEVAFESTHEQTTSIYMSDIFGVAPNGSGLRRLTNPPDSSQFGSFPKASAQVTIANHDLLDSVFVVYVAGAPQMQVVTVTAGNSATVNFSNVAVFSGKDQYPVAIDGVTRWIGSPAQLAPGSTASTRVDIYASSGYDYFGARNPVWRSDGAELDDAVGQGCVGEAWPASAPPGTTTSELLQVSESLCPFDRGPTAALANEVLYWNYFDFSQNGDGELYQTIGGSSDPGTPILDTGYSSFVYDLKYLPDGSGFLWSEKVTASDSASNLYRYSFSSHNWTQLTSFTDAFVNHFAISPDGQYVVFEHCTQDPIGTTDTPTDLWLMKVDGTILAQPFVANATYPAWSRGSPTISPTATPPPGSTPTPTPFNARYHVYVPAVMR